MKFILGSILILFIFFNAEIKANDFAHISLSGDQISININPEITYIDTLFADGMLLKPTISGAVQEGNAFYYYFNLIVPAPDSYKLNYSAQGKSFYYGKLAHDEYDLQHNYNQSDENLALNYVGLKSRNHIALLKVKALDYDEISETISIPQSINIKIDLIEGADRNADLSQLSSVIPDVINPQHFNKWATPRSKSVKFFNSDKFQENEVKKFIKIKIDETGIYQLTASKLASAGADISSDEVNSIKIFGKGGVALSEYVPDAMNNELDEQEIIINKNPDGTLNNIVFLGMPSNGFYRYHKGISHYINSYSNSNYYILTWGGEAGKRAVEVAEPTGQVVNNPTNYVHRIFEEEELVNPYPFGSGRQWLGRSFFSSPFVNVLHNLDRNGEILYKIWLAHASGVDARYDIYENSNKIGSLVLYDNNTEYAYARRDGINIKLPASQIANDNRSVLLFDYKNSSSAGATPYFDYYEIHYPRSFTAIDNELFFMADTNLVGVTEYTMNGFSGEKIYGFDISNAHAPKLLKNLSTTGGIFKFREDHDKVNTYQYYISSKIRTPEIEPTEIAGLREYDFSKDVILVTHRDLLNSAEKYKEYRESNSDLKIGVFLTEHIYNEFAGGMPDPTAIRDFIAYAYHNWANPPKYIVLWGDGHFDFKNINFKNINFVPTYEVIDDVYLFSELQSFNTDDYFASVDGDDVLIDLAVGRITINSDEEGLKIIEKINHYENNSSTDQWRSTITLVADDSKAGRKTNSEGQVIDEYDHDIHTSQTEGLARDEIPKDINLNKIYLVEYPTQFLSSGRRKPTLTQDMLVKINNSGAIILNWIGHGNPRVWAHEFILEREKTIPLMINWDKLFFLSAATCDYGRFDNPNTNSGAEEMFLSEYGGAIGVFSATRIVYSTSNAALNERFYNSLFSRNSENGKYLTLGEAYYRTKSGRNTDNDIKYFLLGDPTMRLLIPQNIVSIKRINGIPTDEITSPIILKALQEVTIEAEILNPLTNEIDEAFAGTAVITMHDGDEHIEMTDPDSGHLFDFTKFGGALNRSSYKVENGRFTATFTVPKDISYSDTTGRLFAYAFSDNNETAKGNFHNFKVNGITSVEQNDFDGPEIEIYLDSRDFKPLDIVSMNPLLIVDLSDETGINTTGLGIGHKIEAWINDSPIPIDLTNDFKTSITNPREGSVEQYLFDLPAGTHKVKVRAWDIYNNFSENETEFIINPDYEEYIINDELVFPNPFNETTTIKFSHNIEPPFDSQIKIYASNGKLVKNISGRITTLKHSSVVWDGTDMNGNQVPQGVYFISIYLKDDFNEGISKGLKAVYIK